MRKSYVGSIVDTEGNTVTNDISQKIDQELSKYPLRRYPKGQILVFADEDPEHVFYLKKGKVRQYDISYRGDEIVVNVFRSSTFFPMSWAINRTPNKYFFKTEEDCDVHIVPPDDVVDFVRSNPDVLFDLMSRVYKGTDGLLGRIVHLMSGSAKSRLLYEIIIECRRFGQEHSETGGYLIKTNESDLAARSGMSRETVSREMSKLKKQGYVELSGGSLIIKDLSAIEQKVGREI
jgi:CRP-like cAMP-binding protein